MARRVLDVFLSSTALDLTEYRTVVHERLMRTGLFHCVRQEDFGAQNAGAVEFCRRKTMEADMFVGLIGLRRGWEPDGDNEKRSITEMEHDWAREAVRPRYLWVSPDNFPVPGNMRENDEQYARQMAFRKRVMGGGERIVSQKGFGSPELLASEIVERLLTQVVTTDLLSLVRLEDAPLGQPTPSKEEQTLAIAAAVERLAEDKDVDLLALAKNPQGLDPAELEAKLIARAEEHEAKAKCDTKLSAGYWRHIGALALLSDSQKALAAYEKATALDHDDPEGWRYLGELRFRVGNLDAARKAFLQLRNLGDWASNLQTQSMAFLRLSWIKRATGDLDEALALVNEALQLAQNAEWQEGMARAYGNLGTIYRMKGNLPRAEKMQQKALKLEKELGSKEGMARSYCSLGIVYKVRGDLDRAEKMQQRALKLNEELGSKEGMANAYGNLGSISIKRGDLNRAEEMYLKSLKLDAELGRKEGMAITYRNLANIYWKRKNKAKMCACWRKERDLWREIGLTKRANSWKEYIRQVARILSSSLSHSNRGYPPAAP